MIVNIGKMVTPDKTKCNVFHSFTNQILQLQFNEIVEGIVEDTSNLLIPSDNDIISSELPAVLQTCSVQGRPKMTDEVVEAVKEFKKKSFWCSKIYLKNFKGN